MLNQKSGKFISSYLIIVCYFIIIILSDMLVGSQIQFFIAIWDLVIPYHENQFLYFWADDKRAIFNMGVKTVSYAVQ